MQTDVDIIAKTLYGEARGETTMGKIAVATVIYNRANGDNTKYVKVCLKPKQFSCWNKTDDIKITDWISYGICKLIASGMMDNTLKYYPFEKIRPTNYLTTKLYNSSKCPDWARGHLGEIVDHHTFIELKNW